jgi:O-antigen/teichoic acid export membrane protein
MSENISDLAKYVFLMHVIATLIFGVWFFLSPESWVALTEWPVELASGRMLGAALLMMAVGSFMGYRATSWEQVELYVTIQIVWNLLGTISLLWSYATMTLPVAGWINIGVLVLFLLLFGYVYYQAKQT